MSQFERVYAPYWESERTINPVLVRRVFESDGFATVRFPDGHQARVSSSNLGVWRTA